MRWVRTNRSIGVGVALFALALQFVLSFGHVHLDDLLGRAPFIVAASQAGGVTNDEGAAPDPDHDGKKGDVCAICATLSLMSSSVLPVLPLVVLPLDNAQLSQPVFQLLQIAFDLHFLFQARAPPQFA